MLGLAGARRRGIRAHGRAVDEALQLVGERRIAGLQLDGVVENIGARSCELGLALLCAGERVALGGDAAGGERSRKARASRRESGV